MHRTSGIRPQSSLTSVSPGTSTSSDQVYATINDLLDLKDFFQRALQNQDDPLRFRQITDADIQNLHVGTAQIDDASITTAKIGSLAVTDAKIASVTADKITTGTLLASVSVTVAGNIATNLSGNRVVLSALGLEFYSGSTRKVFLDATTGNASFAGTIDASAMVTNTITGIQTISSGAIENAASGNRFVISAAGIELYSGATRNVFLDAATGNGTFAGTLNATTVAATQQITSGLIATALSPNARIEITSTALNAYDSLNNQTLGLSTGAGTSQLQVIRSDGLDNYLADSYSSNASDGARYVARRARGSSGSPSAVSSADNLLELVADGWDGSSFVGGASIKFSAAQAFSGSARGTNVNIATAQNGTTSAQNRWGVSDQGLLVGFNDASSAGSGVILLQDKNPNGGPSSPPSTECRIFFRRGYLVIQGLDGGGSSPRYWYLNIRSTSGWNTGTSVP